MRTGLLLLAAMTMLGAAAAGANAPSPAPGVKNPAQARVDYMLKCQGCHRPDGTGDAHSTPTMKGFVARFLHVEGGRQFLAQVPGVASTDLDDNRLADLLNWTLYRFDGGHVPDDFRPYTPGELKILREQPLRINRAETRARLIARMGD